MKTGAPSIGDTRDLHLSSKFGNHPQSRHKKRQNKRGQYAIPSLLPCCCFTYECTLYILNSSTANKTKFTVQTYITKALAFNLNKVLLIFRHMRSQLLSNDSFLLLVSPHVEVYYTIQLKTNNNATVNAQNNSLYTYIIFIYNNS